MHLIRSKLGLARDTPRTLAFLNSILFMWMRVILIGAMLITWRAGADCHELVPADVNEYPWSSIGKLYNRAGEACTGGVISSSLVVTAAHCLYNPRTRILLQPESLHFLIGYNRGEYRDDLRVSKFLIGSNYQLDGTFGSETSDWAILRLAVPVSAKIKPLPLAAKPSNVGDQVMIGGFAQSRQFIMTADTQCSVRGILFNALIAHDCMTMRGHSGAPLLRLNGVTAETIGVHVGSAQISGEIVQIAVPSTNLMDFQN